MNRGLLLDLDGTLCDSLPALRTAYAAFLARWGRIGSDAEFERLGGATLPGIVAALRTSHVLAEELDVLESCYSKEIARARRASTPMEGASELLAAARKGGWRVAVVTSGRRSEARGWLVAHELGAGVDVVVGGEEVAAPKPAPEAYELALSRLGCTAGDSLAVEDSRLGLLAALGARLEAFHLAPSPQAAGATPEGAVRISALGELIPLLERRSREPGDGANRAASQRPVEARGARGPLGELR